jgi:NADH:ubiquinone oxidoreductase subunit 3 (subunit A)
MFAALLVALLIWALLAVVHWLFAGSRRDAELASVYECGFSPVADQVRTPIPLHFYLVGVLFLLFDLEVVLVYPYAVTALASTGLSTALYLGFIVLLTLGYAYELACGAIAFAERDTDHKDA